MKVLMTGASRGIGLELVRQLATRGDAVWALARKPQNSPELVQLSQVFDVHLIACDIESPELEETLRQALSEMGSVDLLINNAGLGVEFEQDLAHLSVEKVRSMFEINAVGPMRVTRTATPWLKKSKMPRAVHISSVMGSIADNQSGRAYGYRMSKTALNMFNKCFSVEEPEITSLVLHPGWVKTEMGGKGANLDVESSVKGLLHVIDGATPEHSGQFFDFRGTPLPW